MPCTVTIAAKRLLPGGGLISLPNGYKFYLLPSRGDITVTVDGGTTWIPWQGDPNATGYQNAIIGEVTSGAVSFVVPYTDTEVHFPAAGGPPLQWNIIDPGVAVNGGTAPVRVWHGILPSAVTSPQTLDELTQLVSDPWLVASTSYFSLPAATRRRGSVTFTAGQLTAAATWPTVGTSAWSFTCGVRTDDTSLYVANVQTGTETDVGCTFSLSQAPPVGKTVQVDFEVLV